MNQNVKTKETNENVKKPIKASLLMMLFIMFAALCVLIFLLSYVIISKALYAQFDSKLTGVVTYIENNIDADDLENCLKTGRHSEKYDETQRFLNNMIDDLGFDYIYIVIPKETVMVNAISATNAAERAAGEDDMALLEETDAYTAEMLSRFRSYWDSDKINFFEETSEYGSYYTACKPLRNSRGETVALICVDLLSSGLRGIVNSIVLANIIVVIIVFAVAAALLAVWLNRKVTNPLRQLQSSTYKFSTVSADGGELEYDAPKINTENEVKALSVAIEKMTGDIKNYIKEKEEANKKAAAAEEENARLAEKAEAAAKIAQISKSVTTLLDNMPALTFYKDSENGKYIACNQAFAEYACRNSPKDVIGLTDFEIFDGETAAHFTEDDKKALSMDVPYILLETVPDAAGNLKYFQTTKLKFKDTAGETRLLGMCVDLTEMASIRNESEKAREAYEAAMSTSLTYSRIAHALSTDYTFIYYVNIDTDEYIEYRNLESGENLNEEQRGHDFFDESRKNALTMLYAGDREVFINAFTKKNVLEKIDSNGAFTFTYRLLIDGTPTYMNMKATRIKDDPMHIIFGVYNVDEQMKYRETLQRLDEERTTYSRITALSGDFICIYTVDPETERYVEYSATSDYDELGFAKEGDAFFDKAREDGEKALYYEDKDMFLSMLTRENVLSEVKDHGIFSMKYRLIISGKPEYVMLKAALVNEKGGPQLIIGVNNIDAQIKREQEYDYNLSVARSKANIDALTGVKNKHAYVDMEALINSWIEERDTIEFAIAVFDVNDLKKTNDTMGHRAGDDLIRGACSIICRTFKHSPVFRVGGDEFAVIAQGQDYENMETLVDEVAEINLQNKQNGGVVVACGMAKYNNERSVAEVFERADNAMYKNKHRLKE